MDRRLLAFCFMMLVPIFIINIVSLTIETVDTRGRIVVIVLSFVGIILLFETLIRSKNRTSKVLRLLYHDCSPEAFLMETRALLDKESRKRPWNKYSLILLMSIGEYAAGRYEQAMDTLQTVEVFPNSKNLKPLAYYQHQKFLISLEIERLDIAWGCLVIIREVFSALKGKAPRWLIQIYEQDTHLLNVARGDCENAKSVFLDAYTKAQTKYERVCAAYTLGRVCTQSGEEDDAREAFEYVVQNGNTLYIVKPAAEYLGLMLEKQ